MKWLDGAGLRQGLTFSGEIINSLFIFFFLLSILFSYEIIYQYGGIYLDTDSRSIRPFGSQFQNSFVCFDAGWNTLGKAYSRKRNLSFFFIKSP